MIKLETGMNLEATCSLERTEWNEATARSQESPQP